MRIGFMTSRAFPLALLWSCAAVGPDYSPPTLNVPQAFADRDAQSVSSAQNARWWEALGSETLNALVEDVLASNLDLAEAIERVEGARAAYGIVRADRGPNIGAEASYARSRPLGFGTDDQWTIGGRASWEIDLFGRVRRSIEASLANFEAEVADLQGVQVAIVAETVATYLQCASLKERIRIAHSNVQSQERSKDIVDKRFAAGMAAGLDPAQAEVNLARTQASLPALELALRRSQHRLAVLAGRDPSTVVRELALEESLPAFPATVAVGIPADLIRNRPDIRFVERRLAAQSARVGVATAARYPALELAGSWDWLAREPGDLFDEALEFGSVGPTLSLPIFQSGRLRANVDAEESKLRQLHLALRQRVLVAQEEVENSLFAIVRNRHQAELLGKAVEAAQRSVELSRNLYTSGQSDFQNVLDAQRSQFALEDEHALARLNALLDLVDLYRSLGGGWDTHQELTLP